MRSQVIKNTEQAYSFIECDLLSVRSLIDEQIASTSPVAGNILNLSRAKQGNMLRPALVLLGGRCCGQINKLHLQVAAIVELMHTATLLHDDVIDESPQHRGRQPANSFYGNEAVVLSGDFIFSRVFRMCAELPEPVIGRTLANASIRICQSELEQNFHRGNWQLSEADYIRIITEKTAAFLSSCCYLGAFAAGAKSRQLSALADFGLNIGIAFQIIDDVLDIIGNGQTTGKRVGNDFTRNVFTLPVIHLLSAANSDGRSALVEILRSPDQTQEAKIALLTQYGCLDYACARAADFHRMAVDAIADVEENIAKTALLEIADSRLNRVVDQGRQ